MQTLKEAIMVRGQHHELTAGIKNGKLVLNLRSQSGVVQIRADREETEQIQNAISRAWDLCG
jgi:hypothetical protein